MSEAEQTPNRGWFKKGQSGNPAGRPRRAVEPPSPAAALLASEAVEIMRACIERAKAGDAAAMRLCLERILPVPPRGRSIRLDLSGAIEPVADDAGLEEADMYEGMPEPSVPPRPTTAPTLAPGAEKDAAEDDVAEDGTEDEADDEEPTAAPATTKATEIDAALASVVRAMAEGELTPAEAWAVGRVVELRRRALETVEFERRLVHLEEADLIIAGVSNGPIAQPVFPNAAPGSLWAAR